MHSLMVLCLSMNFNRFDINSLFPFRIIAFIDILFFKLKYLNYDNNPLPTPVRAVHSSGALFKSQMKIKSK